jgi:hypothetical protein
MFATAGACPRLHVAVAVCRIAPLCPAMDDEASEYHMKDMADHRALLRLMVTVSVI